MKRRVALAMLTAGLLSVKPSFAGVTNGQIVARDRERQLVQLEDGSVYYVPNRNWLFDLRPRRWATIWYQERDGMRVVVNLDVKKRIR